MYTYPIYTIRTTPYTCILSLLLLYYSLYYFTTLFTTTIYTIRTTPYTCIPIYIYTYNCIPGRPLFITLFTTTLLLSLLLLYTYNCIPGRPLGLAAELSLLSLLLLYTYFTTLFTTTIYVYLAGHWGWQLS